MNEFRAMMMPFYTKFMVCCFQKLPWWKFPGSSGGVPHYIYVHLVSRDRKGNRRAANEKGPKRNPTAIPEVGILAEFWNILGGIPVGFRKA
jgi:hypothetical protein